MADLQGTPNSEEEALSQAITMSLKTDETSGTEAEAQGGIVKSPIITEPRNISLNALWEGPTALFLGQLTEMGISENAAIKGLYYTKNRSVDEAATWIFDNLHLPDINEPLEIGSQPDLEVMTIEDEVYRNPYKMVFVVNTEHKMGVGKVAAQVGHATIGLHRKLLQKQEELGHTVMCWEDCGELKVVVKGDNVAHLMDIENQAKRLHLPTYLVHDAGRTQIAPGSVTVLATFGATEEVDKVTGKLKLL